MERRLVKLGGSISVSLPAPWLEEQQLEAGDTVIITPGPDRVTISRASLSGGDIREEFVGSDDKFQVRSLLFRAYLSGSKGIKLRIPGGYTDSWKEVEQFSSKVLGKIDASIIEGKSEVIMLFSESDQRGTSVVENLKRCFGHVLEMSQHNLRAFEDQPFDVLSEADTAKVLERELDRSTNYIRRLINKALYDPEFFYKAGIGERRNALEFNRINLSLERVGDLQAEIIDQLATLMKEKRMGKSTHLRKCLLEFRKLYEGCASLLKMAKDSIDDLSKSYDLQRLKGFDDELGVSFIRSVAEPKDRVDLFNQLVRWFGNQPKLLVELNIMQTKIFALGSLAINIAEACGSMTENMARETR